MQRRRDSGGTRRRISTSLDVEDYNYVMSVGASSDSYNLALIVRAARQAGLKVRDSKGSDTIGELNAFLKTKRSKPAKELQALLQEFLDNR